ncbi:MAG TPA: lytic transglycosylase domain-containing protein, partial [Sphingobium sp.]
MPLIALLLFTAGASAQTEGPVVPASSAPSSGAVAQPVPAPTQPSQWNQVSGRVGMASDPSVAAAISQWRALQQSDGLGFSTYASFIMANPGWPGEDRMRRLAETGINPNSYDPRQVVAFFSRFPPRTATGHARNAMALMQTGRMNEARIAARSAWVGGSLSPDDEARLLSQFGSSWTSADHDQRADMLLWSNDIVG